MTKIISTESIILDVAVKIPALPERSGDVLGNDITKSAGGGFNLAVAVTRFGGSCLYAGLVGRGANGDLIVDALNREGIELALRPALGADTGTCFSFVEPDGERTFITIPGAEAILDDQTMSTIPVNVGDTVVVSGYDLAYAGSGAALTKWLVELPATALIAFDPGPLVDSIPQLLLNSVLRSAGILTLNQREAQILAQRPELTSEPLVRAVLQKLPDGGAQKIIIVREGATGCLVTGGGVDGIVAVRAPRVDAIDTTGAGDTHTGVFVAALAEGRTVLEAAELANVAAAIAVTRIGPATAPTRAEVKDFNGAVSAR